MEISPQQKEQLALHWQLVKQTNKQFNLTAITDDETSRVLHYEDSLQAYDELAALAPNSRVLDIGSGAGFPALVLATLLPQHSFFLLESTGKKCSFLQQAAAAMQLDNVSVLNMRAEDAGRDKSLRDTFDAVTARAVAALPTLSEYALPLLKPDGLLLAYKGVGAQQELAAAQNALQLLGGSLQQIKGSSLSNGDARMLIIIAKSAATPDKYPRRNGMPLKRPL